MYRFRFVLAVLVVLPLLVARPAAAAPATAPLDQSQACRAADAAHYPDSSFVYIEGGAKVWPLGSASVFLYPGDQPMPPSAMGIAVPAGGMQTKQATTWRVFWADASQQATPTPSGWLDQAAQAIYTMLNNAAASFFTLLNDASGSPGGSGFGAGPGVIICTNVPNTPTPTLPAGGGGLPSAGQCTQAAVATESGWRYELRANQFTGPCAASFTLPAGTLTGWVGTKYNTGYTGNLLASFRVGNTIPAAAFADRPLSFSASASAVTSGGATVLTATPGASGAWSAILIVYLTLAATPTATRSPTPSATSEIDAINSCDGQIISYGQSCTMAISGFDTVYSSCPTGEGYTPERATLSMRVVIEGVQQYIDPCWLTEIYAPAIRADKKLVEITFSATNEAIGPVTLHPVLDVYNDIHILKSHPNSDGIYYQNDHTLIKALQNVIIELPSPAATVHVFCQNINAYLYIAVDGGQYAGVDQCRYFPSADRYNATSMKVQFSNTSSDHHGISDVFTIVQALSTFVTATPSSTPTPSLTPTRTPSMTPSVRAASSTTPTRTASPTRTATNATPSVSPTGPTASVVVELPCALAASYVVPVAPGTLEVQIVIGMRFVIADANVVINYGDQAITINPGNYTWEQATATYTLYSLTSQARMFVCIGDGGATMTMTATVGDVGGSDDDPLICVYIPDPPADQRGPMPDVALTLPTWPALPTLVTATVVISTNALVLISMQYATSVARPAGAVATWTAGQFGADGWSGGQLDAAPITSALANVFGWLLLFGMLGQFTWLMPPILIAVLLHIIKPLLSLIRYIKQILPFQ